MNKYVIIGPPGSGKSTQSTLLCQAFGFVRISVGDIFRWNIKNRTRLAAKLRNFIDAGRLVPDDIVEEVIKSRLEQHDWNYGFVLDGYPATRNQARFFLECYDIDGVILLEIPESIALQRLSASRVCAQCGLDYDLIFHRARAEMLCDLCGGTLEPRSSDAPETVKNRYREYNAKTAPVIDLFRARELAVTVDGTQEATQVHASISRELGLIESSDFQPRIDSDGRESESA
jgi:adenylate kinase